MADESRLGASFSIDITNLKAGLTQANRLIKESNSQFKAAAAGLDGWAESEKGLTAKLKNLNEVSALQAKSVKALQDEYEKCIAEGLDPMSAAAVNMRIKINNAKADLAKTESETKKYEQALKDLQDAAENAGDEIEDTGEQAKDSGEGFTIAKGAIANLISDGLQQLVGACKNAISSLMGLSAETREFRQDISSLNAAFQTVGFSSEQATETWKELYAVIGEDDRAVEVANNISRMAKNQQDLNDWVKITTGIFATYQDALPVESLSESASETAKVGKITGVMADALNWSSEAAQMFAKYMSEDVTNAEDAFNVALSKCTTEAERQALVTETLTALYSEAADTYTSTASSVMDANRATAEYNQSLAALGEKIEPTTNAITHLKTEFMNGLAPVIEDDVIPAVEDFVDSISEDKSVNKFTKQITNLAKTVLPSAAKVVKFLAENIGTLAAVTLTAITVFKTFSAVMAISSTITACKTAVAGLTAGVGLATKAQTVWNAAMMANPIGAVITAVALLTTGIILLAKSENKAEEQTDTLTESQREAATAAEEAAEAYRENRKAADEMAAGEIANINYTQQLWGELQTLADENGKVQQGYEGRASFILGQLNEALGTEYSMNGNIVQSYKNISASIDELIEKKKAQILLEAYQETYAEAIKNVAAAEQDRAVKAQDLANAQDAVNEKQKEANQIWSNYIEAQKSGNEYLIATLAVTYEEQIKDLENTKSILAEKEAVFNDSNSALQGYYAAISGYENASVAATEGNTAKVVEILNGYSTAIEAAKNKEKQTHAETVEALKQKVVDTSVHLGILEADYKENQSAMTAEEKKEAKQRIAEAKKEAESAKEEYYNVGGNMVEGMSKGAEDGEYKLTGKLKTVVNNALKAAKKALGIESPSKVFKKQVGLMIDYGIAEGVDDGTSRILSSLKNQAKKISNDYSLDAVSASVGAGINVKANKTADKTTAASVGGVTVYQTNNYSQAHSRYELYKSKQQTAAAVRLAMQGG